MSNIFNGPLRTTVPFTRINDDLILKESQFKTLLQNQSTFLNQNYRDNKIPNGVDRVGPEFVTNFLQESFVYVITETVGEYPYPYFSEKTWKAIICGVPFMLVGAQHSIKALKEFGFQTFDRWWSEDYDCQLYVADRIESIASELQRLCLLDISELTQLRQQMVDVIAHNQEHLPIFEKKDLDNIRAKVYNTV
jgi:hypothetical protein